jgi:hypothetical protein
VNSNTFSISYPSVAQGLYTLFYTNAAGLGSPISAWPRVAAPVAGDGTIHSFLQTISGPGAFFNVGVQQ